MKTLTKEERLSLKCLLISLVSANDSERTSNIAQQRNQEVEALRGKYGTEIVSDLLSEITNAQYESPDDYGWHSEREAK